MKLLRIKIIEIEQRPLLNGLQLPFADDGDIDDIDPNCLIGVNGSGKSQLLETIADIFFYLDKIFRRENRTITDAPCLFEIDYSITLNGTSFLVSFSQTVKRGKAPLFSITDFGNNEVEVTLDDVEDYLPARVIGYTSGDNETLSIPFLEYYDGYASMTASRALNQEDTSNQVADYDPRFYLMDYNTNKGVVISNFALGDDDLLEKISQPLSLASIRNFQLIFQTNHQAAKGKNGIQITPEHKETIESLKRVATMYEYSPETNRYVFDFYLNEVTKAALEKYFVSSKNLYSSLYKIELLNNLIIDKKYRTEITKLRRQRRQLVKLPTVANQDKVLHYSEIKVRLKNDEVVDYVNLSDGEHQFLNVFGTILMMDEDNSIFLLDEPETHFNPKWRREFVKIWNDLVRGRRQDNFITSHSPFVVSDCKKYKVYIFKKKNGKLEVLPPTKETYGASFDYILTSAFDLESTVSEKSFDDINELLKSNDIQEIERSLSSFGESPEKFYLLKRIEELKIKSGDAAKN